jgi:hypothetical protein
MRALAVAAAIIACACGTIAEEELELVPAPHNGVGPFRPLDRAETGVPGSPAGRVINTRGAVATPMVADGHLFYAFAEPLPDVMPPEMPGEAIDWSFFAPRAIHRALPGDERLGFPTGSEILSAEAAWEGESVRDPWAIVLPNGRALLYYAGDGGIGLAEATSVSGSFTRAGETPILAPLAGETLARPSVVLFEGTYFMYIEIGDGTIARAESSDGRTFTRAGTADVFRDPVDGVPDEVAVAAPGAIVATTVSGRSFLRLYLESHRADGTRLVSLAGSADGRTFERLERPVVESPGSGEPGPTIVDERVSVLYYTAPAVQSGLQTRAIVGGVAPLSFTFQ